MRDLHRLLLVPVCGCLALFSAWNAAEATSAAEPATATASRVDAAAHPLDSLAWLIGEWTSVTDEGSVLVSSRWCDDGHYILREFLVKGSDGVKAGGSQRIGWDPKSKQFRCWTFDSLGGFGEGRWRQVDKSWVVDSEETLANGETATTHVVLTPVADDRFVWEVQAAAVNGESLPTRRVEFIRAKP